MQRGVDLANLWRAFGVILGTAFLSICLLTGRNGASAAGKATPLPSTPVQFSDVTRASGINFVHFKGSLETSTILEEAGPGVCVGDYDGDGYMDIYFVNGRDLHNRGVEVRNALYHNNGNGTFTDVTEKAGVPGNAYGLGCVWGDYDNDGHPDLYVTQYGKNILYHNNGDGTFTDVTDKAGVGGMDFGTIFHTGATFFDYDKDGYLDLYVGGYANFTPASKQYCSTEINARTSCPPAVYGGTPAVLYHNNGDGTFTNVTKAAKIYQPNGINLAVAAADYDNDGWPDLFVSNDGIDAYLYHNNHDGTFTNVALETGVALTGNGSTMAAMCISLGDYDNDGFLDLYVSDFQGAGDHLWHSAGKGLFDEVSDEAGITVPTKKVLSFGGGFFDYDNDGFLDLYVSDFQGAGDHLWHSAGKGLFDEVSDEAGITVPTKKVLSFGGGFFDYDNDGWLDLFIANGHVYPEIDRTSNEVRYKEINSLFHNERNRKFVEVSAVSGSGFKTPYVGRGVAFADFDNDGAVELVVGNDGDPPLLLHNGGGTGNHFLNFKLVGTKSNRDAMGARLRLRAGGLSQIREIAGGGSYLSQSDLRANFGLGRHTSAEELEVSWPSGQRQVFRNIAGDKFYMIVEGTNQLQRQVFGTAGTASPEPPKEQKSKKVTK